MGRIYKSAQQVLIWLEKLDEDMLGLFDAIDETNESSRAGHPHWRLPFTEPSDLAIVKTHTNKFDDALRKKMRQQLWKFMACLTGLEFGSLKGYCYPKLLSPHLK
jgi:hypothetical protein